MEKRSDEPGKKNAKEKKTAGIILTAFIVIPLVFMLIRLMGFMVFFIPTGSMEPAVMHTDIVMAQRTDKDTQIRRGDVIIFVYSNDGENKTEIKRVIGLPGEKVEIKNGIVYINNKELKESYLPGEVETAGGTYDVPENTYFVMGDNRPYSKDSRVIGCIDRDSIRAIAHSSAGINGGIHIHKL